MFSFSPASVLLHLLFSLVGFLLGGVMFSAMIPKYFCGVDTVAESRDGNPGAGNVFMHCGVFVGTVCLLLDIGKGLLPVYTAWRVLGSGNLLFSLVLAAPVLGHTIAPFSHWEGGKGIATSFGVLLALLPSTCLVFLLAIPYLFFTVLRFLPHRKRSILVFGLFGLASLPFLWYTDTLSLFPGCLGIAGAVILRHLNDRSAKRDTPESSKTPETAETSRQQS